MSKFRHHKYTYTKPFKSPYHSWELVGPEGGIHLHVSLTEGYDPSCGLEYHHTREAWTRLYGRAEACHHKACAVTGEPCWHDGTSMGGRELWEKRVRHLCERGDHDAVFRILEGEYDRHFSPKDDE